MDNFYYDNYICLGDCSLCEACDDCSWRAADMEIEEVNQGEHND
jgi:hypothetical protein